MPVSLFLSGDSFTDAISKGTRDQGYLYQLQRELRAADQTYNFNVQSQPLQLDALRQNIETTRLQNEITSATSASYIDATNAGNIYTGARSRARLPYVDQFAGLEAASAQQVYESNRIQLANATIGLQENVARIQTLPSQIARKESVDAANFGIAGVDASKISGLDRSPSQRLATTAEGIAANYVDPKTGVVNSGVASQGAPAYTPPPGVNPAVYNTLRSEVSDYDVKGPIYRSNARVYGVEAADAMGNARRETLASIEQVSSENDTQRRTAYDSRVAFEKKDIESLKILRENEELKAQIAQLKGGATAPAVATTTAAPVTAPSRPDPLASAPVPSPVASAPAPDQTAVSEGQQYQPSPDLVPAPATRRTQVIRIDADNPQVYDLQDATVVEDRVNGGIDLAYTNVQPAPVSVQSYDVSTGSSAGEALPIISGDPGAYFQGMIRQESRGKQFNASGGTLTSSAGALGAAQIMPGTGPEAARLAGVPYDSERLRNDIQYNVRLGQAYYRQQYKTFGSLQLAAAAYNAGPGAVRKAIRRAGDPSKGEVSMAAFLRYLPKETQGYVRITSGHFANAKKANP